MSSNAVGKLVIVCRVSLTEVMFLVLQTSDFYFDITGIFSCVSVSRDPHGFCIFFFYRQNCFKFVSFFVSHTVEM